MIFRRYKIKLGLVLALLCLGGFVGGRAQLWQSVGGGCSGVVHGLFPDSTSDLLFVVGAFHNAGSREVWSVATWDGNNWEPVGGGTGDTLNSAWGLPILSATRFGQDIFVGGNFRFMEGDRGIRNLARWNGLRWNACGNPSSIADLEVTNNRLFALGGFDSIGGNPARYLAAWNGQQWTRFGDPLNLGFGAYFSCSEYFNGSYYFAGNFYGPNNFVTIIRWDGINWSSVGSGLHGNATINDITIYKDVLYVGGEFHAGDGNAASYLMAWDGYHWFDPFPEVQYTTQVKDLEVIGDELYIIGNHYVWNGTQWEGLYNLAKYDGETFCDFGGKYLWCLSIAEFQNELYVSTGKTINPFGADSLFPNGRDTVNFIAKWLGGDSTDICISQPVHAAAPTSGEIALVRLFPTPTQNAFSLTLPPHIASPKFQIRDPQGRTVAPPQAYTGTLLDVSALARGLYFVEVSWRGGRSVLKLLKE